MKIYFQNKVSKKYDIEGSSCRRCPFGSLCSWSDRIINCVAEGWQISGESPDIFCL